MTIAFVFVLLVSLLQFGAAVDCARRKDWPLALQWLGVAIANGAMAWITWQRSGS